MTPAVVSLPPSAPDRVLSTLNPDGSRRWLRPRLATGRFLRRRRAVAWALIALFTALPYVHVGGKPAVLLDVTHREFTVLGTTFLPTETMLLMLLLVGIFLGIFLLTAIAGRAWCGWACPQTVYMEFAYRPLERLIEGGAAAREPRGARRWLKAAAYVIVSMIVAHTFLAYFVGVDALRRWVTRSPLEHPVAFLVMAGTTALMLLDFGWFREQVCLVACPYGRFQSVLLDRRSLIVGYDDARGEPRGIVRVRRDAADRVWGDCIDCKACVAACPTGIDIRDGLQMECIHCTQCIDACDAIMDRIRRPRGLVRYTSQAELDGEPRRWLRPRVVLYPVLLVVVWGALALAVARRESADVTVLRAPGGPFAILPSGDVSNHVRIKIVNRGAAPERYLVQLVSDGGFALVAPDNPLVVPAGKSVTTTAFVTARPEAVFDGARDVQLRVTAGGGFSSTRSFRFLGPTPGASLPGRGGS
jgi:cytochrome c oxidase accessory protein FixG